MPRKLPFSLIAVIAILIAISNPVPAAPAAELPLSRTGARSIETPKAADYSAWFIEDPSSTWLPAERILVEEVLVNTLTALDSLGPEGPELLDGYRFRRFPGAFAKNLAGKIALVNHSDREVILSATILQPGNEFFIYHELGHIVDHRSERALDAQFHQLTLETEGATTLHEWTTAQGFFMRGQSHIKHTEATADAFALWVWVEFAGETIPHFHDTPASADPDAILDVFGKAIESVFPR